MNTTEPQTKSLIGQSRSNAGLATKKPKLKLFVWKDFCPDYTSGMAFAIAKDETEARKLIAKQRGLEPYEWGILTIYPLSKRVANSVCGGG